MSRVHTILYFGPFDQNFRHLTSKTTTYRDRNDVEKDAELATPAVTGLRFRYMQRSKDEFLAVGVDDLVLRAPVLIISERHTDGKGFANGPHFGADSAMRLLIDMALVNPEHRDVLARLIRDLGS